MGNVDFPTRRRNVTLNLAYGGVGDDDVGVQIITPDGDLSVTVSERTAAEIHDSLGAYLKRRKEERDRKRRGLRGVQAPDRRGAKRGDGDVGGGDDGGAAGR